MNKTIAIVQARMGSTRLPGKVMADLGGAPMIDTLLKRLTGSRTLDAVCVATSEGAENDALVEHVERLGYRTFRGSEDDVLGRYAGAAQAMDADVIVRVTADCPFLDPEMLDAVVALRVREGADWAGNVIQRRWPDGLDVEAFTRAALDEANQKANSGYCRRHVTPYLHGAVPAGVRAGKFKRAHLDSPADFSSLRWTVDEPEDLTFARRVVELLREGFGWLELVALILQRPQLSRINGHIGMNEGGEADKRREGSMSFARSNQHFGRASESIPLASQTFSKSYMTWTKGAAPLFLERGRGAKVWDIDGNAYVDYVLGLLPIVLGYCDPDVDEAIEIQLRRGITFSLPATLEAEVAERIIRHVPCAEMVRFGKNGSDATTAAIRLARAHTGRDAVLVGGYHGWHDWYIGTTTRELGVPKAVRALSGRFLFNNADSLEDAIKSRGDEIAAVVLEPAGTIPPASGFLERAREVCTKHGIVLVFDEIITGFRIDMGGAQSYYGVVPDLACFGKAVANGMPLSAITGRRDIMRLMEDVFISGTMGGETLSLAAAAATIDKVERDHVPARLWELGKQTIAAFNALAVRKELGDIVSLDGEGWWPVVRLGAKLPVPVDVATSLLRQEFVAHNLLIAATFNLCAAHDDPRIQSQTFASLDGALSAFRDHLNAADPRARLRGDLVQPTFRVR